MKGQTLKAGGKFRLAFCLLPSAFCFWRMIYPMTNPALLQRLEGFVLLLAAVSTYARLEQSWWLFVVLLLAPDLFMLGYLAGPRVGAAIYNFGHLLLWPLLLIGIGVLTTTVLLIALGAIWLAHIGMDRVLGYGFKLSSGFRDTHLGRIGS